jgi:hypothetical protein
VIRNVEQERGSNIQQPDKLFGRCPEKFPPLLLPSAADLDAYVAMVAEEERIRGLTSSDAFRKSIDSGGENLGFGTLAGDKNVSIIAGRGFS